MAPTIPVEPTQSFALLIHHLAERYHGGKLLPLAQRVGVSSGTASQWRRGLIHEPGLESIEKLCTAYDLVLGTILRLVRNDLKALRAGRRVPIPDLSDVRPGPASRLRRTDRLLAEAVAGVSRPQTIS